MKAAQLGALGMSFQQGSTCTQPLTLSRRSASPMARSTANIEVYMLVAFSKLPKAGGWESEKQGMFGWEGDKQGKGPGHGGLGNSGNMGPGTLRLPHTRAQGTCRVPVQHSGRAVPPLPTRDPARGLRPTERSPHLCLPIAWPTSCPRTNDRLSLRPLTAFSRPLRGVASIGRGKAHVCRVLTLVRLGRHCS